MAGRLGGGECEGRLRAIGWLLDSRDLGLVALALEGDTVVLTVRTGDAEPEQIVFGAAELGLLLRTACGRRDRRPAPSEPWASLGLPAPSRSIYQELLRAIGRDLDSQGACACQLAGFDAGFLLRVSGTADEAVAWRTIPLDTKELRYRADRTTRARALHSPTPGRAAS